MSLTPSSEAKDFMKDLKDHDPSAKNLLYWDDEKYFADREYVTNSQLKLLEKGGPQHLQAYLKFGQEEKAAFIFGSALHCMVLEPDMFEARYYTIEDTEKCEEIGGKKPRLTKVYKEWKTEIEIENAGRQYLSMGDMDRLIEMFKKLHSLPSVMSLLKGTKKEMVYQRTINGIPCKCKVDAKKSDQYIVDLKTMADPVTEKNFTKALYNYGYDQQGAFYKDIAGVDTFWFIAIEKKYPYTVGVFELSQDTYEGGKDKYERSLKIYRNYFIDKKESIDEHFVRALI